MAAAEPSSAESPHPPLSCRARRLVFDRRYGWIFDEWTDPADQALSGGRGMFCVVPMAQSLVNAAASSVSFVASSVTRVLGKPRNTFSPAHISSSAMQNKQKSWFRELEHSGVVVGPMLIDSGTDWNLWQVIAIVDNGA